MTFYIGVCAFVVFLILESVTSWYFIRYSKSHYPRLWKHAGKPTLLGNQSLILAWPLTKYLLQKKYQRLKDQNAIAFAKKNRLRFVISYFGSWISVIWLILVGLIWGWP